MTQRNNMPDQPTVGIRQDERILSKNIVNIHEFYLCGEIESAENYITWFDTIRHSSVNDVIKIYINSIGGNLFTTIQFMNALKETEAQVIISVEGICVSAATMIFMQGDSFEIADHSSMMIHNYSSGMLGKGHEMYSQAQYENIWSSKLISEIYEGFLTTAEIQKVIDGADLWMQKDEMISRLEKLKKFNEDKAKKAK